VYDVTGAIENIIEHRTMKNKFLSETSYLCKHKDKTFVINRK